VPIADWTVPFELTSAPYAGATRLPINTTTTFNSGTGIYLLDSSNCSLTNVVRQTKDYVPQEDGAILHRRFTGGMEMALSIQFWQDTNHIACDELLQEMMDDLMGYLYGLINAGDNQGRIAWTPDGDSSPISTWRMLDDIRLLSYPEGSQQAGNPFELKVTIDCELPYAEDLSEVTTAPNTFPTLPATVTNYGNRPTYPVFQVYGSSWTIVNTTTSKSIIFSDAGLPTPVGGGYVEINTFRNTAFLNGNGANMLPGIDVQNSEFFTLIPGANAINPVGAGAASLVKVNGAWA
jgi:hypothetical protein